MTENEGRTARVFYLYFKCYILSQLLKDRNFFMKLTRAKTDEVIPNPNRN